MVIRRYLDQKLKLHQLRAVAAIETERSLLKAATRLGVTQPALSKALAELEALLGVKLFERHARGVRPTVAGGEFVLSARRILAELRRTDEALDRMEQGGGAIAIGALPVAAAGVLPGAVLRLRAAHPHLAVRLVQGRIAELLPLLAAGEIDVIVGRLYQPAVIDAFIRRVLWDEPLSFFARAGHPVFARSHPTIADLRQYDLILPMFPQRVGGEIDALLGQLGIDASEALRTSSHGLIREMLYASNMISLMPRLMMVGDLLRGALGVVPTRFKAVARPAGLILRDGGEPSAAMAAFIACLHETLAEIAERGLVDITSTTISRGKSDRTVGAWRA